jgi:hypothetical protein
LVAIYLEVLDMDLSDLTYAMDKLNLYRAGQLGQLQSPQAMELYRQMYGAATSKPVQQVTKQVAPKGLGALGKSAISIMRFGMPEMAGMGAAMLLDEYNANKQKEAYIQDNLRRQAIQERLKNMPMTIQADTWYKWERLE